MNCDNLFTAYAISGLVKARYWRLPITVLYSVGFVTGVPDCKDNFGVVAIGDVTGLASAMFTRVRRSVMYFLYIRCMPCGVLVTSIPRKYSKLVGSLRENRWDKAAMKSATRASLLPVTIISST